jgi:hypothetical protein
VAGAKTCCWTAMRWIRLLGCRGPPQQMATIIQQTRHLPPQTMCRRWRVLLLLLLLLPLLLLLLLLLLPLPLLMTAPRTALTILSMACC